MVRGCPSAAHRLRWGEPHAPRIRRRPMPPENPTPPIDPDANRTKEDIIRERDTYLQAIYNLLQKHSQPPPPLTEEEMREMDRTGIPFEAVIAELEKM